MEDEGFQARLLEARGDIAEQRSIIWSAQSTGDCLCDYGFLRLCNTNGGEYFWSLEMNVSAMTHNLANVRQDQ